MGDRRYGMHSACFVNLLGPVLRGLVLSCLVFRLVLFAKIALGLGGWKVGLGFYLGLHGMGWDGGFYILSWGGR